MIPTAPLDWPRFQSLAADGDGLADLVGFYIEYVAERLEALRAGIDANAADRVEQVAHQLAGSNATAGATAIVGSLLALEQMAHEGHLDGAAAAFAEADAAYARIREFLHQQLNAIGPHV